MVSIWMGDQLSSPFDLLSQLIAIACEHLKKKTVVYWGWWWAWGRGAVDKATAQRPKGQRFSQGL